MDEGGAAQQRLSMRRMTAACLAAIILAMLANALLRGPAIDEFATLHLADIRAGIGTIGDRWLHDTHPPFFTIWATLLSSVGVSSIAAARLLSNVPPLVAMIWTARRLTRRQPDQLGFHAALLLLILSVPATIDAFASYRSDFWQIAALTILVQVARHIAMADADLRGRRDQGLAPIAIAAAAGAIMVHYVGGIFGITLTFAMILCALAKGFRRWARLLVWTAIAAGLCTLSFAWFQSEYWAADLDRRWIAGDPASAMAIILVLALRALIHNPVPLAGLAWLRHGWQRKESGFIAVILGALGVTLLVLIQINVEKPILSAANLGGLSVLPCAMMAGLAAKFPTDRRLHGLLALVSALVVILPFILYGPEPRWQANAKRIAQIAASCPSTRIYAASPWLLREDARSNAARRDDAIFARGYAQVGEGRGFTPQIIGRRGPVPTGVGDCPTLLWIEQPPVDPGFEPRHALAAARLEGLEGTHLSVIRSKSGLVVRADRP